MEFFGDAVNTINWDFLSFLAQFVPPFGSSSWIWLVILPGGGLMVRRIRLDRELNHLTDRNLIRRECRRQNCRSMIDEYCRCADRLVHRHTRRIARLKWVLMAQAVAIVMLVCVLGLDRSLRAVRQFKAAIGNTITVTAELLFSDSLEPITQLHPPGANSQTQNQEMIDAESIAAFARVGASHGQQREAADSTQ